LQRHLLLWCQVNLLTLSAATKEPTVRSAKDTELLLQKFSRPAGAQLHPVAFYVGEGIIKTVPMTFEEIKDWPTFRALSCAHLLDFEGRAWQHWCSVRSYFMLQKYDLHGVTYTKLKKHQAEKVRGIPMPEDYSLHPLFGLFFNDKSMVTILSDSYLALC
jgi:hypothetical protein